MSQKKIVCITSCPVGVAHTYMAAENLEKAGASMGIDVKVETHGSIGIENTLTEEEIRDAEGVIIAADTSVDLSRFAGKKVLEVPVQKGIQKPEELIQKIIDGKAPILKESDVTMSTHEKEPENVGQLLYRSLMNGVSHMVPFVVTGGLLIAISLSLGGTATSGGIVIPEGTFWSMINTIGGIAMGLMIPILSAFIAQSIADRPGLVPGFVGGMVAGNGALYGSEANAGFLGGIIAGFLAGFVAKWIKSWKVPKAMQSIMPIIVIPVLSSVVVGLSFIYIIGKPVSAIFAGLSNWLVSLQGGSQVILAMILGAMIAVDMGGPFNKVAFLFGSGMIEQGNYTIMGPIAVAICIPPIAMGIAPFILKDKFTEAEQETGKASFAMGLFGITEGAIPFATADPLRVIPSIVVGSMAGSVVAMLGGVTDHVAHGGPIVAVLGAVDNVLMFFVSAIIGVLVTIIMLKFLKQDVEITIADNEMQDITKLTDIMNEDAVILDLKAQTKDDALHMLSQQLTELGYVDSHTNFKQAILDREEESTTGIGEGIAIPHGSYEGVKEATVIFARHSEGLEWNSLDGEDVHLIFMIAVPKHSRNNLHLKILQMLSRKLMDESFRKQLLEAKTKEEIIQLLENVQ